MKMCTSRENNAAIQGLKKDISHGFVNQWRQDAFQVNSVRQGKLNLNPMFSTASGNGDTGSGAPQSAIPITEDGLYGTEPCKRSCTPTMGPERGILILPDHFFRKKERSTA